MVNKNLRIKSILIILLSVLSMTAFAQVKKVAILETVDKNGDVAYSHKLMIRSNLAKVITNTPGYEGYDRTDMKAISDEHNFQRTGMVSDDQIKKLGEMTGAQYILVAEAVNVDKQNIFITAKILNVETAKMDMTDNILSSMTPPDIQHACEVLAYKLLGITPPPQFMSTSSEQRQFTVTSPAQQNLSQVQQPAIQESTTSSFSLKSFPDGTYGIVFYTDNNNHGLAVSLIESSLKWEDERKSKNCHNIKMLFDEEPKEALSYALGAKNTDAIVNELGAQNAPAAAWCQAQGSGWYLPSAGELWYMMVVANDKKGKNGRLSKELVKAGGTPLDGWYYWSSNEKDTREAINVSTSGSITEEDKTAETSVRAVRAF